MASGVTSEERTEAGYTGGSRTGITFSFVSGIVGPRVDNLEERWHRTRGR